MNIFKSKSGFTLIELLVVIGILAVLAAIAIPSVAGLIDRANVSADKTNANEMTNAMERFAAEYELYCQDIASGVIKADTTDFDAAQGRVYNVTGALSRSDIETLEVAQGATVADDQIAIYRDTKYPVNAMTAKSIVMNYTKTSSSTFEPKQSDMHFWYSPDCGVVVFAEPNADVVTQLNVQILSGKDAKGNELGASTKWIDLTADTTPVATHAMLNKTDVLTGHNEAYFRSAADFDNFVAVKVDGNVVDRSNYTLSEGSTVVVLKPEFVQTLSEGEHTMEIQSTDGSAVCDFTVTAPTNHGLYFGCPYVGTIDGITVEASIYENSALMFKIGEDVQNVPSGIVVITKETIDMTGIDMGVATISPDGKTIYADGGIVLKLIEEDGSTIEDVKNIKYCIGRYQYMLIKDDNSIELGDLRTGDSTNTIPSQCVRVTRTTLTISGTGMFDGTFAISPDGKTVTVNGVTVAIRKEDCKHGEKKVDGISPWYEFCDANGNSVNFGDVNSLSELKHLTLVCTICNAPVPCHIDEENGYIYFYNGNAEPQANNGVNIMHSADIAYANLGGWYAVPFDMTKAKTVLANVDGKPVVQALVAHGATLPNSIKHVLFSYDYLYRVGFSIPDDVEITFQGSMTQFGNVGGNGFYGGESAILEIETQLQDGWGSGKNSITVHCTDGDIVKANH